MIHVPILDLETRLKKESIAAGKSLWLGEAALGVRLECFKPRR
jgi:hypothetical protein